MQIYLPIAEMPISVLLIIGMSAAVGFVSGMFGIGGGFLMTPLLIFLGVPPAVAVATVTAQVAASSMTGAVSNWQRRQLDIKLGLFLTAGGLVGTMLGVLAFNSIRRTGQLEVVIALSYLVLFMIIGSMMLLESLRALMRARTGKPGRLKRAGQHPAWLKLPLRVRFARSRLYASAIPILGFAALVGFIGAVLGIGGGFIMVPALLYLFRVPTMMVVGTSLFQILVTMTAATLFHAASNQSVDIVLAVLLIIGGVIGAQFGGRAGRHLRGESFRVLLAVLLLAVGFRIGSELIFRPEEPFSVSIQGARG
ncbi:MAG: sulfite exporter TauE/SafE family protein [Hyphomicrobiales bacterium]|jgi:uncharacterized membrane protein YfcA|nr:sulfite exporter TauE/SafE family protein [Hyphomicrobiales bacterium]